MIVAGYNNPTVKGCQNFPLPPFYGGGSFFLTLPAFRGYLQIPLEKLQRRFLLLVCLFFLCSSPDQLHHSLPRWDGADLQKVAFTLTLNQNSSISVRKRPTQQEGFCLLPNLGQGMGKEKEKGKGNPRPDGRASWPFM